VVVVVVVMMVVLVDDDRIATRVTRVIWSDRRIATRERRQQRHTHYVAIESSHGITAFEAPLTAIGAPPQRCNAATVKSAV
jgi:hypothetical protein